ncbi:MAG: hypothetical protein U1U88_002069 [Lawsonella clevelandensis]
MFEAQEDTDEWYWKTAWGSLLRTEDEFPNGQHTLRPMVLSIINVNDDKYYTDKDGVTHHISLAGCTQILELSPDGRHLFSHDPWLPNDYSYEWGTPVQSRSSPDLFCLRLRRPHHQQVWRSLYPHVGLRLFRRRPRTVPLHLHQRHLPPRGRGLVRPATNPSTPKIRIPVPDWTQQPKIPGEITDRLSVESVAVGSAHRLLKVEGRKNGVTGYWKKMLNDRR